MYNIVEWNCLAYKICKCPKRNIVKLEAARFGRKCTFESNERLKKNVIS